MTGTEATVDLRRLLPLLVVAVVVAVLAIVVGIVFAGDKQSDIAFEAAKAGLQLGIVTFFGTAVAFGLRLVDSAREQRLKQLDVAREERAQLREYRLSVFRDTVDAYNEVKRVRRTLRALGFVAPIYGSLSTRQIDEFQAQMSALNEAELSLEKVRRELEGQKEAFPKASRQLGDFEKMEKYLRGVLKVWETQGALISINEDAPPDGSFGDLKTFLAKRSKADERLFWHPFKALENAIRADLIESPATSSAPNSPERDRTGSAR